ncbi:carboxypeptidase-like regulatory domain-containing protein [Nannocystis bainbridge]|uniref:Carboxypeptidase-like regulatory domain-containing protein n=1 Tax=Nannocystis bainbridge TaxID=2995303 RepID=A0ABT5E7A9_9BACT|nr:carboxypeptidase-like regulatory domain-containing protein [Nannocystis bainbridge]MDC0721744.1 carboxypeptidase-like regulatory domain-containing protein [Nannocystis bainbridge]
MPLSLSWLILTLATAPAAEPAATPPTSEPAPAPAPAAATADAEARAEQAAVLYGQKKYLEAAQIFEDLWASVHEPRDLFNAGLARLALGHRAHAIRYWEIYLQQTGIPADGREQAQSRSKKAQAAATGVIVKIAPSAVAEFGATLTLTRVDDDKDQRPPLVYELPPRAPEFTAGGKTIHVDPGKWELKISAPTYGTSTRDLTIKPGAPGFVLDVALASDPAFRAASFQIGPGEAVAAGATVSLQRLALGAVPVPCPLDGRGNCAVRIEPGDWEVTVQAPGYQRHVEKISLGAQPTATFAVALAPSLTPAPAPTPAPAQAGATPTPAPAEATPAPPPVPERVPKKTRVRVSTGLIVSGVPVFITGLALAVHGSNVYDEKKLAKVANGDMLPAIRLRSAGSGLMGVAVGLWATGLTAEYDVKPWVWWTEIGVGAAALLTGGVWAGVSTGRWNANATDSLVCTNNEGLDCFTAHRLASGFFLGLGAGAIAGATTGLLVQRFHLKKRRVSFAPTLGGGQAGFLVHGRF